MKRSMTLQLPQSRMAQLTDLVRARSSPDQNGSQATAAVLAGLIQREWERVCYNRVPDGFRIKAGRGADAPACVLVGHDAIGDLLLTTKNALALARGAHRVASGRQQACLVIENHFARRGVLVYLRPDGEAYALSFGKRDPLVLTQRTTLELSRWLMAAAERADARG